MLSSIVQSHGHWGALATGAGGNRINILRRELDSISANLTEFLWPCSSQRTVLLSWELLSLSACWEVYLDSYQGELGSHAPFWPCPEAASCHGFCLAHGSKEGLGSRVMGGGGGQETGSGPTQSPAVWLLRTILSRPQLPSLILGCLRILWLCKEAELPFLLEAEAGRWIHAPEKSSYEKPDCELPQSKTSLPLGVCPGKKPGT